MKQTIMRTTIIENHHVYGWKTCTACIQYERCDFSKNVIYRFSQG